ncbi:chemotaxis protein methyltransferase CheR [Piscibacillus halophilus]|uniref:protein-glutamate O-methyltransferase n=1 Tax=Piscibacillus halophilus TaxID=571933 RepID=A0A1H8ZU93_9BACI|nr:chemotaxis protein methyltransferase CheR [Piscibacillus halophilus]
MGELFKMSEYQSFIKWIYKDIGVDLNLYKEKQMKRRLTSLRDRRGFNNFKDYYDALNNDDALRQEFLSRITINVSQFYRNYKRWDILKNDILPDLLKSKAQVKVWSAACSTGEEPYTMAMLLSDFYDLDQISILATDIDDGAIEQAKVGVYSEKSLSEVPQNKIERFFTKEGSTYIMSDEIKKTVTFKKHNLLADDYGGPYDLIVCRNVLIYFTEDAKRKVYQKFNEALTPQGILFVGSTEQLFRPQENNYEPVHTFFYKKMGH